MRRYKEIQIPKAPGSDPLGYLPQRMDFLVTYVHNVAKNLPTQLTNKFNLAASTVPIIVLEAIAQQLPNLLTATIRNSLPQALTNVVRETLHGFNRRIRNSIKVEMSEVLKTSVLKPLYKEFNALNKL
ncbi:hypothetical protein Tco_1489607 [Tanacetum coccineum]